jgi:hypothetical protein
LASNLYGKYNLELLLTETNRVTRAGEWLLNSGIQDAQGGVARYRRTDLHENLPVSTEITGYAVSGLLWLFEETGEARYLDAARLSGDFLRAAWNADRNAMPFEVGDRAKYTYFFDCGIIARALLWLHRATLEEKYLETAVLVAKAMERDFRSMGGFHPILLLPCKSPAPYEAWWSRMPGAFQLKAALAWRDAGELTGDEAMLSWYQEMLEFSVSRYRQLLDLENEPIKKMDRLHAWAYFLEGLQPESANPEIKKVLRTALVEGETLREALAPEFLRSDVCAQLLRVRLLLGGEAPCWELERIESFQYAGPDRTLEGGFAFGSRNAVLTPHVNPVSTIFCFQALSFARLAAQGNAVNVDWRKLI